MLCKIYCMNITDVNNAKDEIGSRAGGWGWGWGGGD